MAINHPSLDEVDLASILSALGDATRLAMVGKLANTAELGAGQFSELGSKTVLSYHMAKLREAGLVKVRAESTRRFLSLRRDELNDRFPGLLDTILPAAMAAVPVKSAARPAPQPRFDDWID